MNKQVSNQKMHNTRTLHKTVTVEGVEAYLKDLPEAEMHRLDSGHFAVEDCLDEIARCIPHFYLERVTK